MLSQPLQPPHVDVGQTPPGAQPPQGAAAPPATPQPASQPAQPGHQPPAEAVALDSKSFFQYSICNTQCMRIISANETILPLMVSFWKLQK